MVNRTNKRAAALMRDAVVRDLDGSTLVVTVKSPALVKMMATHAEVMTAALYEELGGRWEIRCEVAGERGGGPPAPAQPPRTDPPPNAAPRGRPAAGPHAGRAALSRPGRLRRPARTESYGSPAPSAGPARPATPPPADDDWPEAARPGVARQPPRRPRPPTTRTGRRPAPIGGAPAAPPSPPRPGSPRPPPPRTGPPRNPPPVRRSRPSRGPRRPPAAARAVSGGLAAARAAAAGRGARTAVKTADADWAGEPPYDPEYDGPPKAGGGRRVRGLRPRRRAARRGVDERTARQSSEEQALRLLKTELGAEKIDEIDVR